MESITTYLYRTRTLARSAAQRWLALLAAVLVLCGCEGAFDIHPYDVNIKGPKGINATNTAIIERRCLGKDTLRIAVISDTHGWYSDTRDEIASLNQQQGIDFVIHSGDLTDTGTAKEFEWIHKIMYGLNYPYLALIGNHDFLGTGNQSYEVIYGEMNFSIIAGRVKIICINTNATEYDYMAAVPNLDYIESEATARSDDFDRTIVVMHAPPYSDQFNNNVAKAFRYYLNLLPNLMFCVYGHNHITVDDDLYGDGLMFHGVGSSNKRKYRIFTITPTGYEAEIIEF